MKKIALIFVTVTTLATTLASPVEARGWRGGGWGWGPGIGLGIAAGALAAGAYGVSLRTLRLWSSLLRLLRSAICILRTGLLPATLLLRMVS